MSLPSLPWIFQAEGWDDREDNNSPNDTRNQVLAPILYSKFVKAVQKDDLKKIDKKICNLDA